MDYIPYKEIKYYSECAPLVEGLGFKLVELKIIPTKEIVKIGAVIASENPNENIGINDCAKVHRVLLPRLEALLGTENTSMELTSPGIEHNLKNAAEFGVFINYEIRIWDKTVSSWISGIILSSDEKSVTLKIEEKTVNVLYENIAKAKFINK